MSKKIMVIIGSIRENRIGGQIGDWLQRQLAPLRSEAEFDVVDLKELDLPFFTDESPSYFPAATAHGKAWRERIAEADGVLLLTPEYNRSIPAPVKNAIDYAGNTEWGDKPVSIVSYGYIDGGLSVTKHLVDVFEWLKAPVVATTAITLEHAMVENGTVINSDADLAAFADPVVAATKKLLESK